MAVRAPPGPVHASEPPVKAGSAEASIDLYWLPLGAGGHFVRLNGRIYETLEARHERRPPLDLYHIALEVHVPEGRFIIENAWPIPDVDGASRGVVVEGPVFSRRFRRLRVLRYGDTPVAQRGHCGRRRGGGEPTAPERGPSTGP